MECRKLEMVINALVEERNKVLKRAEEIQSSRLYEKAGELKAVISFLKNLDSECNDCQ